MATNLKGYRFHITAQPQVDAQAAHAARTAHDDWRINNEGRVFQATMRGEKVWATKLLADSMPVVYITQEQAARFGLCPTHFCGQPATYVGFEGLRCSTHAKYGMSLLCTTEDCTRTSETGFSSHCAAHTTPTMRAAREARQAELRARYATSYRY